LDPAPIARLGRFGPRLTEFKEPRGPAVDPHGKRIFVGDPGNGRLQVFALEGREEGDLSFDPLLGELVKAVDFGAASGAAPDGRIWPIEPTAIACDALGSVFVLDARNAAVFVLDAKLRRVRSFGGYGRGSGELRGPTDLALDPLGKLCYVVDADNQRLQVFDLEGGVRGQWGRDGAAGLEPFARPLGVGVDPLGRVYVADEQSHTVLVFDAQGKRLAEWGGRGSGPGQFRRPSDVLIAGSASGGTHVHVIDAGNRRGQVLTEDGRFVVAF
jgi:DNA-binding beta-propeller fold protein YncE